MLESSAISLVWSSFSAFNDFNSFSNDFLNLSNFLNFYCKILSPSRTISNFIFLSSLSYSPVNSSIRKTASVFASEVYESLFYKHFTFSSSSNIFIFKSPLASITSVLASIIFDLSYFSFYRRMLAFLYSL